MESFLHTLVKSELIDLLIQLAPILTDCKRRGQFAEAQTIQRCIEDVSAELRKRPLDC